ncbi:MAG: hypothetical protein LBO67_09760 [Spirochaetaceae bacterium]|jgi:hypothetical protein|nr:hypothetical protein [Spirochaetaceae bacterium]
MSIYRSTIFYQKGFFLVFLVLLCSGCSRSASEAKISVVPTYPLSRPIIAYGVINVPYTTLNHEPDLSSTSFGYLRKGDLAQIIERRSFLSQGKYDTWVMVEPSGWIREAEVDLYENEAQAHTAQQAHRTN